MADLLVDEKRSGGQDAVAAGTAPAPAALSLAKKGNGNNRRTQFVAEMNISCYIRFAGESQIMVGYLTCPGAQSLVEFQRMWKSFLNGVLKKRFPSGMAVRERQSRTGDWHAHFVVHVGFDVRSGYPWNSVKMREYRGVDSRIRDLWRVLREKSEVYGFGRSNLEPLKASGQAAARYVSKYLSKRTGSDKMVGEERCALFTVWGTRRYCSDRFSWNTIRGRENRRRLSVIARTVALIRRVDLPDILALKRQLGASWWKQLRRVVVTDRRWPA